MEPEFVVVFILVKDQVHVLRGRPEYQTVAEAVDDYDNLLDFINVDPTEVTEAQFLAFTETTLAQHITENFENDEIKNTVH